MMIHLLVTYAIGLPVMFSFMMTLKMKKPAEPGESDMSLREVIWLTLLWPFTALLIVGVWFFVLFFYEAP